jgi:hypothetical protein
MRNIKIAKMKFIQGLCFLIFTAVNSIAQNVEIHNLAGQDLDSLAALYNRKVINYTDPANNVEFIARNTCTKCKQDTSVNVCSRVSGDVSYKIFFSDELSKVLQLKTDSVPTENEISLFYQTFQNRVYDFNKEERPERYIGISLSAKIKKAIKKKQLKILDIVKMYEHTFFDKSKFSGMALYMEIENKVGK